MVMRFFGRCVLLLLALALAALALGAFASLNYGAPLWLRTLSVPEGVINAPIAGTFTAFPRAVIEALLCSWLVYQAAYWPKPIKKMDLEF